MLLWQEYRAAHEGQRTWAYTQFCEHYKAFAKTLKRSMRQQRRAGEKQRATRLRAGPVLRAAPHPWQACPELVEGYACACYQTIQAAPMPAQMIDKGIPAPGLLAQVVVAKHDDHLPLYRQTEIYARSGVHIARSSMARGHVGATS